MSVATAQLRILAVDDHVPVRQGLAVLIGSEPELTLLAQASGVRRSNNIACIAGTLRWMDLQMPEVNGLDAIIAIRSEFHQRAVIGTRCDQLEIPAAMVPPPPRPLSL